jgi:hypothetical protein
MMYCPIRYRSTYGVGGGKQAGPCGMKRLGIQFDRQLEARQRYGSHPSTAPLLSPLHVAAPTLGVGGACGRC